MAVVRRSCGDLLGRSVELPVCWQRINEHLIEIRDNPAKLDTLNMFSDRYGVLRCQTIGFARMLDEQRRTAVGLTGMTPR